MVVRLVLIFGGHPLNFFRNAGYMKIIVERSVADVPGCVTVVLRSFDWNR